MTAHVTCCVLLGVPIHIAAEGMLQKLRRDTDA